MGLILPDTNVLIFGLKGLQPFANLLKNWIKNRQLLLSSVVIAEYLSKSTPKEAAVCLDLANHFNVLPVDLDIAKQAAEFRKTSLKHKQKLHLPDCLIAAQCKFSGATLATLNPTDYPQTEISILSKF